MESICAASIITPIRAVTRVGVWSRELGDVSRLRSMTDNGEAGRFFQHN
jgi:hypothetical protein